MLLVHLVRVSSYIFVKMTSLLSSLLGKSSKTRISGAGAVLLPPFVLTPWQFRTFLGIGQTFFHNSQICTNSLSYNEYKSQLVISNLFSILPGGSFKA